MHRVRFDSFERQAQSDDPEVSASVQLVVIINDKAQRLAAWERLHGCEPIGEDMLPLPTSMGRDCPSDRTLVRASW
jgi:hypothetical protein